MSVGDSISFNSFCQLCLKISNATSEKKLNLLQSFIEIWKKKACELGKEQNNIEGSFFPVLRLLLPQLDRERGAYGVKEHNLAKIYIRILSLPKGGSDAMKLVDYKTPKSGSGAGDFAEVAYWVLKKRCTTGGQLSIENINTHLDAIAAKHASGEPRGVDAELINLLKATSAEEQKWLIRILLKDMKLGIGQNTILKSYHPDAKDFFEATNNLRKVCDTLKDPKIRLHEIEIDLFSPVKPMLSEEFCLSKLDVYLKRSRYFFIETKLDGERFQLHKREGDYKYFSRNGYDYTHNFGASRFEGILTPKIADAFSSNVTSCILDGEMMCWNKKTEAFASKSANIDVKHLKEDNMYQPCFCVFDVLLYNDQVLSNQPLNLRLECLEKIFETVTGAICVVFRKRISSKEEVLDSLNEAIDKREEGIVMKEFMSVYKPNVRKNGGWYKIKPEYIEGLSDTLDLLILGGYYGTGRHTGNISHFLLGVAISTEENSKLFYSVSRVGAGYSINELSELQSKLKPFWNPVEFDVLPVGIEWTKEKPDVWIAPENSFVLEVKAAEITSSNAFKTGHTLRFPRVEKVRYDKSWKDCLTFEEFEEKRKMASGKLAFHYLTSTEIQSVSSKKTSPRLTPSLGNQFIAPDVSKLECLSNLLDKKEICVLTGFENFKKIDVERKVIEFGGTLVQNPGKNTFCVLAENDSTTRIKNLIKSGLYDVIKPSFFCSQLSIETSFLAPFKPQNFLAASSQTREILAKSFDEFGDHYTEPLTRDSLQEIVREAKQNNINVNLSIDDLKSIDRSLFSGNSPYSIFRSFVAYFDCYSTIEDPNSTYKPGLDIIKIDFEFFGGKSSQRLNDEVTHVVIFSGDLVRVEEFNLLKAQRGFNFSLVSKKWISECIKNKSLSQHTVF